ncbi:hypothetical protein [Streptomyces sp. CB02923]|uniref:hypothetical protein n=1 Tax=Streptomyces sp. CB02923 TaxID=1718985 RepID=UPI001900F43B|nr:hypothetical protein [Streptomyces sp. CB02923]
MWPAAPAGGRFPSDARPQTRALVNQAQLCQAELVEEGDGEDWWDENDDAEEKDGVVDPVAIVPGFPPGDRAMELTDLIGICQGFVTGTIRLVPKLPGREFSESQLTLVHGIWNVQCHRSPDLTQARATPELPRSTVISVLVHSAARAL